MGGKRWSDEENAVLADISREQLTLVSQMHRLPGRNWDAARNQASRIGVTFGDARAWTPQERALLKRIYASNESIKVGVRRHLPDRTYITAKGEAQRMGLTGTKTRRGRAGYSWVEIAIEAALQDGRRLSANQLQERTGACKGGILKLLAKHHGKKFRIGDWMRSFSVGRYTALWELGSEPDAPRPASKTSTECCRTWRERKKARAGQINPFAGLVQQVTA
ncbi:hypothetical protein [Paraburkholderia sediminicola]|jgi:hypothetical protein|uniref:hypothetical protein n=1 Tax=Paraburkholderia sediminicola TaxID=458836 RepID=UPI0038BB9ADB